MKYGHTTGSKRETKTASNWYAEIEAANIEAADAYAMAQAREEAAMFRNTLAREEAALVQAQIDADDAERALVTALATQVGNAVSAMPEAASRITKAAALVQAKDVWKMTDGTFLVGSSSDTVKAYFVQRGPWTCDCPDHTHRGATCKHILAAMLTVKLGTQYTPSYN